MPRDTHSFPCRRPEAAPLTPPRRAAEGIGGTLALWLHRRNSRRALARLPAAALRDIGLTRREALAEAAKPFWRA